MELKRVEMVTHDPFFLADSLPEPGARQGKEESATTWELQFHIALHGSCMIKVELDSCSKDVFVGYLHIQK